MIELDRQKRYARKHEDEELRKFYEKQAQDLKEKEMYDKLVKKNIENEFVKLGLDLQNESRAKEVLKFFGNIYFYSNNKK